MSEKEIRRYLAITLTAAFVLLLSILNLMLPILGTLVILVVGIIWGSIVAVIYGEE
jgi:hypothetical protein